MHVHGIDFPTNMDSSVACAPPRIVQLHNCNASTADSMASWLRERRRRALRLSLPVRISRHTCLIDFVRLGVQEVLFSFGFYKTGMILDMYDWLHNTDSIFLRII